MSELERALGEDARRSVADVRAAAARIWKAPLHRAYTDHTAAHSERIVALLEGLTAGMRSTEKRLSPAEVYVLLAAAYLHDIGMQNERYAGGDLEAIRDAHHEQTEAMIYAVYEDPAHAVGIPRGSDPGLVEAVALVAKGHRKVDLSAREYDPLIQGGEVVRLRLLAALLRFADELDIDYRRVDLEQMKLMNLPILSQLHWWKCHYVSGVRIVDEYIQIAYRVPQDRPDYGDLIVPLVEREVREKLADLEAIFRQDAVKVAIGKSQVRPMRLLQPLPDAVERLAKEMVAGRPGQAQPAQRPPTAPPTSSTPVPATNPTERQDMERERELRELILDSYGVIREWERIRQTGRPEEKLQARLTIAEHWEHIAGYLDEYRRLVGGALPADLAQIAAHFGPISVPAEPRDQDRAQTPPAGSTYNVHIQSASGLAIGNGAQVIQQPSGAVSRGRTAAGAEDARKDWPAGWDSATVRRLLAAAFDDQELTILCYDHFRPVYEDLATGMPKGEKVQRLLEHCERHGRLDELLDLVRARNPVQYERYSRSS